MIADWIGGPEILQHFDDLAWLETARLRESTKNRDPNCRWAQENDPTARRRNRYLDVKPWKHNRIHLQVPPGRSDYINASPVTLRSPRTDQVRKYIVTQGPKAGQNSHFWQMVWHETSSPAVIVMLTQCYEADREKCSQYFPDQLNGETMMIHEGPIGEASESNFTAEIRLLAHEAEESSRSVVRKLELRVGTETKIVWHLLFAGWPDWGVPDSFERGALFELIKLSRAKSANPASPPIIHCSAGVGRSGTFITLDYLLSEMDRGLFDAERSTAPVTPSAEHQTTDIVYETVNKLREQRMMMVQSDAQLLFIYQVLREKWLERHGKTEADLRVLTPGIGLPL